MPGFYKIPKVWGHRSNGKFCPEPRKMETNVWGTPSTENSSMHFCKDIQAHTMHFIDDFYNLKKLTYRNLN